MEFFLNEPKFMEPLIENKHETDLEKTEKKFFHIFFIIPDSGSMYLDTQFKGLIFFGASWDIEKLGRYHFAC